ncbi:MAG: peptidyl-prolyl cis-trans isomerase [Victivallaceae bacterium]|nr:peptidyl-prolyl cis-trans isomerase [Victivallaceae bacterium]
MKLAIVFIAMVALAAMSAPVDDVPDPVAVLGGRAIPRSAVEKRLIRELGGESRSARPAEFDLQVRGIVEEYCFKALLDEDLSNAGIVANEKTAIDYVESKKADPETKSKLRSLTGDKEFQYKAAVHMLLDHLYPGALDVGEMEISDYYNYNRSMFRIPENTSVGIIAARVDEPRAREKMEDALAQLRQKVDFARIAEEMSHDGMPDPGPEELGEIRKLAKSLRPGERTDIVTCGPWLLILKLENVQKAGYVPLDQVRGTVMESVTALKEKNCLERHLKRRIEEVGLEMCRK